MGVFGLALFVLLNANYGVQLVVRRSSWLSSDQQSSGAVIELVVVVRRLFTSPRLVLLIATIGVGQILLLARVSLDPRHRPTSTGRFRPRSRS